MLLSLVVFSTLAVGFAPANVAFAQREQPLAVPEFTPRAPIGSDFVFTQEFNPTSEVGAFAGWSVDIDGNVAVVGAPGETIDGNVGSGAVYIYRRTFTPAPAWTLEQKLTLASPAPPGLVDGIDYRGFGISVAVDGTKLVVGAPGSEQLTVRHGSAFFYEDIGGTWIYRTHFTVTQGNFGQQVALDGNYAAVGNPRQSWIEGAVAQGGVNLYTFSGANWAFLQSIDPSGETITEHSHFGTGLALDGETLLIGQPGWRVDDSIVSAGRVWEFRRGSSGTYDFYRMIDAPETGTYFNFGASVDVFDGTFENLYFIGMPKTVSGFSKAFMFADTITDGFELISVFGEYGPGNALGFGRTVAIDQQDTLRAVVGGENKLFVLERTGTGKGQPFVVAEELQYGSDPSLRFGIDAAIDNYGIHIGASGDDQTVGYSVVVDEYGLGINTGTVQETLEEGDTIFYTVRLTGPPTANVTVTPAQPFGGSAFGQCDNFSPSLTFTPANYASEQAVLATVVQDTTIEGLHNCTISNNYTSSDPNYYENLLNGREISFTIVDDDQITPVLNILDSTGYECTAGYSRDLPFVVQLSATSSSPVSVDWQTFPDSATENVDYDALSSTLTIPPGANQGTILVEMRCDDAYESGEHFVVSLSNPIGASIGDGGAFGEIQNDDSMPSVTVTTPTLVEGDSGNSVFPVTVTFTSPTELDGKFFAATVDGTAAADTDYQGVAGLSPLIIPAGAGSVTFNLTVFGDTTVEDNEIFQIRVSPAEDEANFLLPEAADYLDYPVTILNDDSAPVPEISISDASLTECDGMSGNVQMSFSVSLSMPATGPISVNYQTVDGTALNGVDYSGSGVNPLSFVNGQSSTVIQVSILCDDLPEGDESFTVLLSSPSGMVINDGSATGTIIDNDTGPTVSISDETITECSGGGTHQIFVGVSLSFALTAPVEIGYQTSDGTALAGSDYIAQSGVRTIPAYNASAAIPVMIHCDDTVEADETFTVTLTGSTYSTILDGAAAVTLEDDDTGPVVPAVTIGDAFVVECTAAGSTPITFPVTLNQSTSIPVDVDYDTSDITALAGVDYVDASGILTFSIGETYKAVTIYVLCDATDEADETFSVDLVSTTNSTIADGSAVGTIYDDDDPLPNPIVYVSDSGGYECSPMPFYTAQPIVSAANLTSGSITIDWMLSSTTATAGEDYVPDSGTVTLTPGLSIVEVPVIVLCDEDVEPDESVQLVLTNVSGAGATVADNSGDIFIVNDDPNPVSTGHAFLLNNGGFESLLQPSNWIVTSGPTTRMDDVRKCNKPQQGKYYSAERDCAFVFKGGHGENSQIQQVVQETGSESTSDVAVLWMLYKGGASVNATAGFKIVFTDGTPKQKVQTPMSDTHGRFSAILAYANLNSAAVKKYIIYVNHRSAAGKLTLDSGSFYLDQSAPPRESPAVLPPEFRGF